MILLSFIQFKLTYRILYLSNRPYNRKQRKKKKRNYISVLFFHCFHTCFSAFLHPPLVPSVCIDPSVLLFIHFLIFIVFYARVLLRLGLLKDMPSWRVWSPNSPCMDGSWKETRPRLAWLHFSSFNKTSSYDSRCKLSESCMEKWRREQTQWKTNRQTDRQTEINPPVGTDCRHRHTGRRQTEADRQPDWQTEIGVRRVRGKEEEYWSGGESELEMQGKPGLV